MKLDTFKSMFHTSTFTIKKHSPEILLFGGLVGGVASTLLACKATYNLRKEVMVDYETQKSIFIDCGDREDLPEYTKKDVDHDIRLLKVKTGVKLMKRYAPSLIIGSLSIASILMSNKILRQRNLALAAAYKVIDAGFKSYRKNVIEKYGEDVDREMKYGLKKEVIKVDEVDPETGEVKKVKKTIDVIDPGSISQYARFFDELNPHYNKDPEYNMMFLRCEQNYLNDLLVLKGRLFLNDVYERLGIEPSKAGQVVGWIYDKNKPSGDNFVDFGIFNTYQHKPREHFVNGYTESILLDFNVDGVIWDDLDDIKFGG